MHVLDDVHDKAEELQVDSWAVRLPERACHPPTSVASLHSGLFPFEPLLHSDDQKSWRLDWEIDQKTAGRQNEDDEDARVQV